MKKFWMIYTQKNSGVLRIFETQTEVEDEARRLQSRSLDDEFYIMESVAKTRRPVPAIEIDMMEG